jgi:hypothetical protein
MFGHVDSSGRRRFALRAAVVGVIGAGAMGVLGAIGAGGATAAPLVCDTVGDRTQNRVVGDGSCGAKSDATSTAHGEDQSGAGSAIAAGADRGRAYAYNTVPGGTALSGASKNSTAYAVTVGPGGFSLSQGRNGGLTVAIAGIGGSTYAGPDGVRCSGGFAAAYDSVTGKYCIGTGRNYLNNSIR